MADRNDERNLTYHTIKLGAAVAVAIALTLATPPRAGSTSSVTNAYAASSLTVHRTARHAVAFFHARYRLFHNEIPPFPAFFKCEKTVEPFCFGPANGSLPFGYPGRAFPVLLRTDSSNVEKGLRKRVDAMMTMLMRDLDAAQKKHPGDRWILGQRVFHVAQHNELERALKIARECRAEKWWCASLVGFVSSLQGQAARADSAFGVALAAFSPADRCKWEDVTDLVWDDKERVWYNGLSCDAKNAANETLWWLADPLYLVPGNERRTEHYFREVFRILFQDSNSELPVRTIGRNVSDLQNPPMIVMTLNEATGRMTPFRLFEQRIWNHGALNSVLRSVGVPTYFMVDADRGNWTTDTIPRILFQYPQPNYHFIPSLSAVRSPLSAAPDNWSMSDPKAVERYHPAFGEFEQLDYQVAYFRRGDSSRIVAAADVKSNRLYARVAGASDRALMTGALFLSKGPNDVREYRDSVPGTVTTFSSVVPSDSTLVSIEASISGIGAMRARFAGGPPPMPAQRLRISDILLTRVRADNTMPASLDEAVREVIPRTTLPVGSPVTFFWEMYGLTSGDTVTFTFSTVEKSTSTLTRVGRLLGVVGRETGAGVSWTEPITTARAFEPRSISIDLSALRPGSFILSLEATVAGQLPVKVTRDIVVASPPGG